MTDTLTVPKEAKVGKKITASDFNRLRNFADIVSKASGSGDVILSATPGGLIAKSRSRVRHSVPALSCDGNNIDTSAIQPFEVAGIADSTFSNDEDYDHVSFDVRVPDAYSFGSFCIADNHTLPGLIGKFYVDGIIACHLTKWFNCTWLSCADTYVGSHYLFATTQGGAKILWEEVVDDYTELHYAIIKFQGIDTVKFKNTGVATIPFGCPCVPDSTYSTGLDANGFLALKTPFEDAAPLVYYNAGGDVIAGAYGKAIDTSGPILARVDAVGSVGDSVGVTTGCTTWKRHSVGYIVKAYLGANPASAGFSGLWAIIGRDAIIRTIQATSAPASNDTQTVQLTDEDEHLSGLNLTLNVLAASTTTTTTTESP